jgi:hypothetical protein
MPNISQFVAFLPLLSTWFPLVAVPFGAPFAGLEGIGKWYQLMLSPSIRIYFAATPGAIRDHALISEYGASGAAHNSTKLDGNQPRVVAFPYSGA